MVERDESLALTRAPRLAPSLASALPGDVVVVDRHGQVMDPARWRRLQARALVVAGVSLALSLPALVAGGHLLAWLWISAAVQVPLLFARRHVSAIRQARVLLDTGRDDEALAMAAPLRRRRAGVAGGALAICATVHQRAGQAQLALDTWRAAARRARGSAARERCRHREVEALVDLGQVAAARALLEARTSPRPVGDLQRRSRWRAELYLAFAEGAHALDVDELHDRARFALGLNDPDGLLGLLAWAYDVAGDLDMSHHLLREHAERTRTRTLPRLDAWVAAHLPAARAPSV